MKKKIVAMCATVALAAVAVGGTLAYFTAEDGAVNTMTTGSIAIKQIEQERGAQGTLVDFQDDHKLAPYTGVVDDNGMAVEYGKDLVIGETSYKTFDQDKNFVDKIVTVYNDSDEPVYARTLLAFEMIPDGNGGWISPFAVNKTVGGQYLYTMAVKDFKGYGVALCTKADGKTPVTFNLDGVEYIVAQYDHGEIAAKTTTAPSLLGLYLNANAGNEWAELVGPEYNVLALTQATQVDGFADTYKALNTAFGAVDGSFGEIVDEDTLIDWFEDLA